MTLIDANTPVGFEFTGKSKNVTEAKVYAFSGGFPKKGDWPNKNIHTDPTFAKRCGLPNRVASGAMSEGYLAELMVDVFGERWMETGRMSLKFIHIVVPGDSVTPKGILRSITQENSGLIVTLDVWCENQQGQKVTIGTATGRIKA